MPTMDTHPTPNQAAADHAAHAERKARHLAMLAELADLTMVLTRLASINACEHLAPAPEADPAAPQAEKQPDPVLAFARLSRALRQTIALEAKLATPPKLQPTANAWQATPENTAKSHLATAILQAAKQDKSVIRRHGPTIAHIQRHIDERLDADDILEAIATNEDFAVIVATICQDLGIPYHFSQVPDEDLLPLDEAIQARQSINHQNQAPDEPDEEYGPEYEDEDDDPPSRP